MSRKSVENKGLIRALTYGMKDRENKIEQLKEENEMLRNNNTVLVTRDRILTGLLKQVKMYMECNNLVNEDAMKRKIKELISTGIND